MTNEKVDLFDKDQQLEPKMKVVKKEGEPTAAFKGAAMAALLIGVSLSARIV